MFRAFVRFTGSTTVTGEKVEFDSAIGIDK